MKSQYDTICEHLDAVVNFKPGQLHEYVQNKSIDFLQMCKIDLDIVPSGFNLLSKGGISFHFDFVCGTSIIIAFMNSGTGYFWIVYEDEGENNILARVVPECMYEDAVEWLRNHLEEI